MTTPRQPGWYDDPHDSNAQRYWDGQDWTPHRQPKQWPPPGQQPNGKPPQRSRTPIMTVAVIGAVAWLAVARVLVYKFASTGGSTSDSSAGSSAPTGSPKTGRSTPSSSAPTGSPNAGAAQYNHTIILNGQTIAHSTIGSCTVNAQSGNMAIYASGPADGSEASATAEVAGNRVKGLEIAQHGNRWAVSRQNSIPVATVTISGDTIKITGTVVQSFVDNHAVIDPDAGSPVPFELDATGCSGLGR